MAFNPICAFLVLPVMLFLIELGRRFRIKHKAPQESTAIESAIFALFGLLLAFTFSGAVERYDRHRELIVEETNAIGTAYLRHDLLPRPLNRRSANSSATTPNRAFTSTTPSPTRSPRLRNICSARSGSSL